VKTNEKDVWEILGRLYSGRKTRVFQDPCSSDGEIPATAVENPTA